MVNSTWLPVITLRNFHKGSFLRWAGSDGVSLLRGTCQIVDEQQSGGDQLYGGKIARTLTTYCTIDLMAIPYYAWANREAGLMAVWLRTLPQKNYSTAR